LDACGLSAGALARRLALSGAVIGRARRHGLTDVQADHWAVRVGAHPLEVWGWAWVEAATETCGRPSYARLAAELRDRILRSDLAPGQQLPTIATLAADWQVGTKTAAKVVDELRAEGLVVGGGRRGWANTVAATARAACVTCGQPIDPDNEHYPHRPHCGLAARGWCDCDLTAHPTCCPTCTEATA
jgi:hypothetical protein